MTTFTEAIISNTGYTAQLLISKGDVSFYINIKFTVDVATVTIDFLCESSSEALLIAGDYITTRLADICMDRDVSEIDVTGYTFKQLILN